MGLSEATTLQVHHNGARVLGPNRVPGWPIKTREWGVLLINISVHKRIFVHKWRGFLWPSCCSITQPTISKGNIKQPNQEKSVKSPILFLSNTSFLMDGAWLLLCPLFSNTTLLLCAASCTHIVNADIIDTLSYTQHMYFCRYLNINNNQKCSKHHQH